MGLCFRCGKPPAERCIIEVMHASPNVGGVSVRSNFLECECCDGCFRSGKKVFHLKLYALLILLGSPCLIVAGCMPLQRGSTPDMEAGLFFGGLLLTIALWVGVPIWVGVTSRPLIVAFLGEDLDHRIRMAYGIKKWTYLKSLFVHRNPPQGKPTIPLRDLA